MGKTQRSLEEAINACIVYASQGKTIDVNPSPYERACSVHKISEA